MFKNRIEENFKLNKFIKSILTNNEFSKYCMNLQFHERYAENIMKESFATNNPAVI